MVTEFMLTVRGRYINGLQKDMLVVYRKVNWIKQGMLVKT